MESVPEFLQRNPIAVAVIILAVSVAVALLASKALSLTYGWLSRRSGASGAEEQASLRLLRRFLFWTIVAVGILLALRAFQPQSWQEIHDAFLDRAGRFLLAFIVFALGYGLSVVTRRAFEGMRLVREAPVLAGLAQGVILVVAATIALEQLGINMAIVANGLVVVAAVVISSLGLAFALGSKDYVANLTAKSELSRIDVGDHIRIGDHEGLVVHVHKTGVEIATGDGTANVPGSHFLRDIVWKREPGDRVSS